MYYTGYWPQTMEGRISYMQITAKVNCKLYSHNLYLFLNCSGRDNTCCT